VRPAGAVREARPVGSSREKRQYRADAASRTGWARRLGCQTDTDILSELTGRQRATKFVS
jgi:hypothetical protein